MNFSFGIVTGGEDYDRLLEVVESIHSQKIPNYEIIIVGGDGKTFFSPDSKFLESLDGGDFIFRHIPFDESTEPSGWISKKKNIITALASYENVVYLHDYHVFLNGWYENFLDFGDDWDICMNSILTTKGERFRDWTTWDHPELGLQAELDYSDDQKVQYQYISGGYWVAKRRVMLFNPIDERYTRGTTMEDVEWSLRVRDKYKYKMNRKSVVKHNKIHRDTLANSQLHPRGYL